MMWLLPHGVVEIPAILIGGQGGFLLAHAIIGRGSSEPIGKRLARVRDDAAYLIGGIVVLLIWAGFVESYLSQTHEPQIAYSVKIAIGIVEFAALCVYVGWGDKIWISLSGTIKGAWNR